MYLSGMAQVSRFYSDDAIVKAIENTDPNEVISQVTKVEAEPNSEMTENGPWSIIRVTTEHRMYSAVYEAVLSEAEKA